MKRGVLIAESLSLIAIGTLALATFTLSAQGPDAARQGTSVQSAATVTSRAQGTSSANQSSESKQYADVKEAAAALLANPRPYSGYAADFPFIPPPLPGYGYLQDWADFGTVEVGQISPSAAITLVNDPRIIGIATTGDFVETDQCGNGSDGGMCIIKVSFRPAHVGMAAGLLVVLGSDTVDCAPAWTSPLCNHNRLELYETRLYGYGAEPGRARFAGTLVAGAAISDSLGVPWLDNSSHCFVQPTNAEAPTLTGVFIEVRGSTKQVLLHHSAARAATFDVYCTPPIGGGPSNPQVTAYAIPVYWPTS